MFIKPAMENHIYKKIEKKKTKIVILLGAPLDEQNYERVGIPYLDQFFEVTVLDCMPWLGRANHSNLNHVYGKSECISINSALEFDNAIQNHEPKFAIDFVGRGIYTKTIQTILSKWSVKFVVQKTGVNPGASLPMKIIRLFFGTKGMSPRSSIENLGMNSAGEKNRVRGLWGRLCAVFEFRRALKAPDIALLAGSKSLDSWTKKAQKILWIGSQDYHLFRKTVANNSRKLAVTGGGRFILFIDECLPHAIDWTLLNVEPPIEAKNYYLLLLAFFEKVEKDFELPVVIAAHPNGAYIENYAGNFGGRQVLSRQTCALALESSLVLTHASTAISFAILARKPIIFLTTSALRDSFYGASVENFAKSIGQKALIVDELREKVAIEFPKINEKLYQRYESNYLKNDLSEEYRPWDLFINHAAKATDFID